LPSRNVEQWNRPGKEPGVEVSQAYSLDQCAKTRPRLSVSGRAGQAAATTHPEPGSTPSSLTTTCVSGADAETVALGHGAVSRSGEYAAHDVAWLRAVLAWAVGAGLLDRNPLIGYSPPSETSPRRPIVTTLEYEALLRASDRIHPLLPTCAHCGP
jgi:hypothetical protein